MPKLTVAILTKNEAENITDCVLNAKQVSDDVLIIDSGSTDDTVNLAEKAGARVVFRAWDDDFSAQRNFAITNSEAGWILYLDADERMSDELIKSVKDAVTLDKDECYEFVRINHAIGYRFKHGVFGPDRVTRLFKRDHFHYVNRVHEHAECSDSKKLLSGQIEHYTFKSMEQMQVKTEQYTTIWAQNVFDEGKRTNVVAKWLHVFGGFIKVYLVQLGILDGWPGLKVSIQHAQYVAVKYQKLLELQR